MVLRQGKYNKTDFINCSIKDVLYHLQLKELEENKYLIQINNKEPINVEVCSLEENEVLLKYRGKFCRVFLNYDSRDTLVFYKGVFKRIKFMNSKKDVAFHQPKFEKNIKAQMPGVIIKVNIREGQFVKKGDDLLIIETMKMHNTVTSNFDGRIKRLLVKEGQTISYEQIMLIME